MLHKCILLEILDVHSASDRSESSFHVFDVMSLNIYIHSYSKITRGVTSGLHTRPIIAQTQYE